MSRRRLTARRLKETSVARTLTEVSRPARRRLSPARFKETYVARALAGFESPTYVEVGVGEGESFRLAAAARKIGVDPEETAPMRTLRPGEEYFVMESDRFFAERAAEVLAPQSVHVALIDGLHEFRQVARDLTNLEPFMVAGGVVFLDDLNPPTREEAADVHTGGAWNGDVWKIVPLVEQARPDLRMWTVDADEGIGVVGGFRGEQGGFPEDAVDACKALEYSELERDRTGVLNLIPPARFDAVLREIVARP